MRKRIFLTLLALALAFSALCADGKVAEAFLAVSEKYTSGDFEYVLDREGRACLKYYVGSDTEVIVPAQLDGHEVVAVGEYCFDVEYGPFLKSVTLPEGITEIGTGAFWECERLETINFPESLKTIMNNAFYGCTSLKEIKIPSGVEDIDCEAFIATGFSEDSSNWKGYGLYLDGWLLDVDSRCGSHFKIRKGTTDLASGLFSSEYMKHVTKVSVPASLKNMGPISSGSAIKSVAINKENPYFVYDGGVIYSHDKKVIYDMVNVPSNYRVASTVTTIMPGAIGNNIKKLVLPKSVTSIPDNFVNDKRMLYCVAPKSEAPVHLYGVKGENVVYNYAVRKPTTSVTLYKKQMATVTVGGIEGGEAYAYYYEANTESPGNGIVKWYSSDKNVMEVSYNDVAHRVKITGLRKGTAYLVAKNSAGEVIRKYKFKTASPNTKAKARKISLSIKKGSSYVVRVTKASLNNGVANRVSYEVTTTDDSVVKIERSYKNPSSYVIQLGAKGKGTATVTIKNGITGKTVAKIKVTV